MSQLRIASVLSTLAILAAPPYAAAHDVKNPLAVDPSAKVELQVDALRKKIAAAGNVYFDIAMVEGVGGVAVLASDVSPQRVVFGSHFPLFNFQSAALKIKEAGLSAADEKAILEDNARRLLHA